MKVPFRKHIMPLLMFLLVSLWGIYVGRSALHYIRCWQCSNMGSSDAMKREEHVLDSLYRAGVSFERDWENGEAEVISRRRLLDPRELYYLTRIEGINGIAFIDMNDANLALFSNICQEKGCHFENLSLAYSDISDCFPISLTVLNEVEALDLHSTDIGDDALKYLKEHQESIQRISLYDTNITDDSVRHLLQMNQLTSIYLDWGQLSDDAYLELRSHFPRTIPALSPLNNGDSQP